MTRRALVSAWLLMLACLFGSVALADDMSDARAAAATILGKFDQQKNSEVWQAHVSDWFKERMTKNAFLANMAMMQAQLGGPGKDRTLVQQNRRDADPATGYKGSIFSFTYATTFPGVKSYELIVLIDEGGEYKLSGINYAPNPN